MTLDKTLCKKLIKNLRVGLRRFTWAFVKRSAPDSWNKSFCFIELLIQTKNWWRCFEAKSLIWLIEQIILNMYSIYVLTCASEQMWNKHLLWHHCNKQESHSLNKNCSIPTTVVDSSMDPTAMVVGWNFHSTCHCLLQVIKIVDYPVWDLVNVTIVTMFYQSDQRWT